MGAPPFGVSGVLRRRVPGPRPRITHRSDVTPGSPTTDELGFTTVEATITTVSDDTHSPWVSVSGESADGSEQYDTSSAIVTDLKPGQSSTQDITFTEEIPSGAKCVITDIS